VSAGNVDRSPCSLADLIDLRWSVAAGAELALRTKATGLTIDGTVYVFACDRSTAADVVERREMLLSRLPSLVDGRPLRRIVVETVDRAA
jgi:hypothetical protein